MRYETTVTVFLLGYLHAISATEVTVQCDVSTAGVCTNKLEEIEIKNEAKDEDNLKFIVENEDNITSLIIGSDINLVGIPYGIFTTFRQLEILQVNDNNVKILKSVRFQGALNLKELNLRFNKIESIEEGSFNFPKLLSLDLSYNRLSKLSVTFLNSAPSLKKIDLSSNDMVHIGNVFNGSNTLEELFLSANKIETIDEGALNLPNLVSLELGHNALKILSETLLHGLPNIRNLILGFNDLTHIGKVFNGSHKLETIDLQYNDIEIIEDAFNIPNLLFLDLSNNELRIINGSFLNKASNLKKIDLSSNQIVYIGNVFNGTNALEELFLSSNKIETIRKDVLNLPNLISLDLGHNALKILSESLLNGLPSITNLNLEFNGIAHIGNVFNGTQNLKTIDLQNNDIETIEQGSLNLPNLVNLNLAHNKIQILNGTLLNYAPNLQKLNLDDNQFLQIGNAFSGCNKLVELILDNNDIEDLNLTAFTNLNNLENLSLANIGFKFPDEISSIPITGSNLKIINLNRNRLSNPDIFKYLAIFPQLEELHVKYSEFTHFNNIDKIREYLPFIRELYLDFNTPDIDHWLDKNNEGLNDIKVIS